MKQSNVPTTTRKEAASNESSCNMIEEKQLHDQSLQASFGFMDSQQLHTHITPAALGELRSSREDVHGDGPSRRKFEVLSLLERKLHGPAELEEAQHVFMIGRSEAP
ncbi:hypothetical protein LR48_Vigan10g226200 [Vigna angularis]|uniref:Uncharacterized protein n=1 Tax=Phaseolus angularis TaxID=3914 RepID=A0A0L9VMT8_PHAAN|nr:hypothetical protein LR48_Vigan10g226200 [Vigna angularis]